MSRILIIGAGLAGLSSALMLHEQGHTVTIVSRGIGGLLLSNGTIDILGWEEGTKNTSPVHNLPSSLSAFIANNPNHPYASIGTQNVFDGVKWLVNNVELFKCTDKDPEFLNTNVLMPTAVGAVRPTAAVPLSMKSSVLEDGKKYLVVGLNRLKDFPVQLIADNLSRSPFVDISARAISIDLPIRGGKEHDATGTTHARSFDEGLNSHERSALIEAIKRELKDDECVLIPAILGLDPHTFVEMEAEIRTSVGEIPLPPPSVPGRRINDILTVACREARIDIQLNAVATGFISDGNKVTAVKVQRAGRVSEVKADFIVDAAGGYESGNLARDSYGVIKESIFDLPIFTPEVSDKDFHAEAIYRTGVRVNETMNPVDSEGNVLFSNLYCLGDCIGGALPWEEKSGEGITLGSAWAATQAIKTGNEEL
ncbi:glycerol-3-phosphate dehydrogenase subunit GlpB [Arcanobacterium ihumii]|uniref:glycerol-3-phosphate dehydrogenase subunit GlpB n=1 Tax=Arcanobacterium ihumii TaxID=2138162 RepID=UPI000F522C98|nr:glycerol-3-phosphate dehydrogenase subunit GlpB [Arcanobacterium ihumii]